MTKQGALKQMKEFFFKVLPDCKKALCNGESNGYVYVIDLMMRDPKYRTAGEYLNSNNLVYDDEFNSALDEIGEVADDLAEIWYDDEGNLKK